MVVEFVAVRVGAVWLVECLVVVGPGVGGLPVAVAVGWGRVSWPQLVPVVVQGKARRTVAW